MTKRPRAQEQEHLWESRASHKELVAKFAHKFPITRKRWRVEGTKIGNSRIRMLTHAKAQETRDKYRGRIVEVIPFSSLAIRQAAKLLDCPHCEAKKGEVCLSAMGNVVTPHAKRWELD